uniref:Ankyrin repeat and zinc finger peptidyl tRNA hydrolase 1 n=1 Tax=Myotis myotis TaxID=51298 RepID=A0A7J7WFL1_MYOMY|nr:ankyrin repeat and zinc finger peptidyl tRNA hydrolase 1 [Myotis myotis]
MKLHYTRTFVTCWQSQAGLRRWGRLGQYCCVPPALAAPCSSEAKGHPCNGGIPDFGISPSLPADPPSKNYSVCSIS